MSRFTLATFQWDKTNSRPALSLDDERALEGFRFEAFGADDEMADTMFAIFVDDDRILTRRPEPMLVQFLDDVLESEKITLRTGTDRFHEVTIEEEQLLAIEVVRDQIKGALENSPLGR